MTSISADVATLRAGWQTVHGGWFAAVNDLRQLIGHRCVLVKTTAPTRQGEQLVLCTRLRLIGDTQTDVLRAWFETSGATDFHKAMDAHFQAVDATMQGWNVALAAGHMLLRLTRTIAAGTIAVGEFVNLWGVPSSQLFPLVLKDPALWAGAVFGLACEVARLILRWRLRTLLSRA